jgi:HK97 family phage prohead protease
MALQLRDTWNASYVNDLPDSAFLYIAPNGSKDSTGRTVPRSLRYFPVRDANGKIDEPHLANALARIPQASSLSADARATAMNAAKRMAKGTGVSGGKGEYTGTAGSGRSAVGGYDDVPDVALGDQERTFTLIMELRSTDGRTLFGRAVPYGVTADVGGFRERFVPGVFSRQVGSGQVGQIKLYDAHANRLDGQHPIGRTAQLAEQPDGLYGAWALYDTSRAEDALKLVKAGEVTGLSVGFSAKGAGSRRADDGVIERHSAHLDHVALTLEPVYADAQVLGVRSRLPEFDADRDRFRELVIPG